jgi:phosphotransferase system HPr-like phosphotransfer protein
MAVKRFVEIISPLDGNFDLLDRGYIVDARSLMGVFSLNLTRPIKLRIEKDAEVAMRAIEEFIADDPIEAAAGKEWSLI